MEGRDKSGTLEIGHVVINLTEQTIKELVKAVDDAKSKNIKDATIYVFSPYSSVDFKINIGDNIESLGYKRRED